MKTSTRVARLGTAIVLLTAPGASAQVLGTFPWQMQPYCNIVTLTLTATPTGFTLDGTDDQCGAPGKASAVGTASFDASGSVTLSFTVVAPPGGRPSHVSAVVSPATGSGTWSDGTTASGAFAFFGATPNLPQRPTLAGAFVTGNGSDDSFTLSLSDAVVRSVGFTLTGPMRVMATASGYFSFHSAAATHEIGRCSITTGTAVDDVAIFGSDAGSTLAPSFQPFSAVRLFSATAGNFTARLVCNQAAGAVRVNDSNLVLAFFPQ